MAAGFLREFAGDRIEVRSAGSSPGAALNPVAVEAMAQVGIDITEQQPRILTPDAVQASDVVITMGLWRYLPILPRQALRRLGIRAIRPASRSRSVSAIRDQIRSRVEELVADLIGRPENPGDKA